MVYGFILKETKFFDMETMMVMPVLFSEGAIKELKRLLDEDIAAHNKVLRVGVIGGGCSGMTYVLKFDDAKEGDEHFEFEGIPFIMESSHEIYLFGMTIEFEGGLNNRGFTFSNPNASKTCGCGTSFAV